MDIVQDPIVVEARYRHPLDALTQDLVLLLHVQSQTYDIFDQALEHAERDPVLRQILMRMREREYTSIEELEPHLRRGLHTRSPRACVEPW